MIGNTWNRVPSDAASGCGSHWVPSKASASCDQKIDSSKLEFGRLLFRDLHADWKAETEIVIIGRLGTALSIRIHGALE